MVNRTGEAGKGWQWLGNFERRVAETTKRGSEERVEYGGRQ